MSGGLNLMPQPEPLGEGSGTRPVEDSCLAALKQLEAHPEIHWANGSSCGRSEGAVHLCLDRVDIGTSGNLSPYHCH